MIGKLTVVVFTVALGASCLAQEGLVIRTNGRQERPALKNFMSLRARQSNVSLASADHSGRK
jgi:hypothetical protein